MPLQASIVMVWLGEGGGGGGGGGWLKGGGVNGGKRRTDECVWLVYWESVYWESVGSVLMGWASEGSDSSMDSVSGTVRKSSDSIGSVSGTVRKSSRSTVRSTVRSMGLDESEPGDVSEGDFRLDITAVWRGGVSGEGWVAKWVRGKMGASTDR